MLTDAKVVDNLEYQLSQIGTSLSSLQEQTVMNAVKIQDMGAEALEIQRQATAFAEQGRAMIADTVAEIAVLHDTVSFVTEPIKSLLPVGMDFRFLAIEVSTFLLISCLAILNTAIKHWRRGIAVLAFYGTFVSVIGTDLYSQTSIVIFQASRIILWAINAQERLHFLQSRSEFLLKTVVSALVDIEASDTLSQQSYICFATFMILSILIFAILRRAKTRHQVTPVLKSNHFKENSWDFLVKQTRRPNVRAATVPL